MQFLTSKDLATGIPQEYINEIVLDCDVVYPLFESFHKRYPFYDSGHARFVYEKNKAKLHSELYGVILIKERHSSC